VIAPCRHTFLQAPQRRHFSLSICSSPVADGPIAPAGQAARHRPQFWHRSGRMRYSRRRFIALPRHQAKDSSALAVRSRGAPGPSLRVATKAATTFSTSESLLAKTSTLKSKSSAPQNSFISPGPW